MKIGERSRFPTPSFMRSDAGIDLAKLQLLPGTAGLPFCSSEVFEQKGQLMQPNSDTISGATGELRSDAQQVGTTAVNRVHSELDARKGDAANQARTVSSAIERASSELDDSVPTWLRSAFQQGAQQVQRFADALEQKDSRELISEVRSFARDNPGTFLAGCAAAGFAAARIFKAGASDSATGFSGQPETQRFQGDAPAFPAAADPALPSGSPGEFV